ncbi:MAG: hypothetical protein QOK17_727 [Sphingomonadales bacterium]|jgi:hypothetical protein|nr:hypothetical protein [Sphingomonadales bacterium]
MKPIRTLALLSALAACAAPQPTSGDKGFERELAGRTAGPPQDCVFAGSGGGSLGIVARGIVGYRSGETLWVNRLPGACAYMEPLDTLAIEVHGGQYCRGDRVSALGPGRSTPGPTCILGQFTPYREARP